MARMWSGASSFSEFQPASAALATPQRRLDFVLSLPNVYYHILCIALLPVRNDYINQATRLHLNDELTRRDIRIEEVCARLPELRRCLLTLPSDVP